MPAYSHLLSSRELSTESSYAGSSERSEGFSKKVRKLASKLFGDDTAKNGMKASSLCIEQ